MNELEKRAREMSDYFLEYDKEYRLGFVEAEQANPKTRTLGETFVKNTKDGIKTLLSVDKDLVALYKTALFSEKFDTFCDAVLNSIKEGGKIVVSGCGATGRLAIRVEASWKLAVKNAAKKNPEMEKYLDSVISLMTGGDYAIIRAVESFEDYIELGKMQADELNIGEKDILIGVTATGETTSILGTAAKALSNGAKCWMVICTNPDMILGKLKRVDDVFGHENTNYIYMKCGGMAVTGSTRMQSSSIEQAVILSALEMALLKITNSDFRDADKVKESLVSGFEKCISALFDEKNIETMAMQIEEEASLYERGGHVTYFADEYLLDILADTTERGPTFSVPPFRPQSHKDEVLSWAFVKNPTVDTKTAWTNCFERAPRCIDKTEEEYREIGIKEDDIRKIPKINLSALLEYEIGMEPDPEREEGDSLATWIGIDDKAPETANDQFSKYRKTSDVTLSTNGYEFPETALKIFQHLALKMMINIISTGTMARMGRVYGNYMVCLNITNKKLVDRASRMISDLCNVDYETANYELYLSKLEFEEKGENSSCVIHTIKKLNKDF